MVYPGEFADPRNPVTPPLGYRRRRGGRRLCGLTETVFLRAMCVHLLRVTLTVVLTRTGTVRVRPPERTVIRRVCVRVVVLVVGIVGPVLWLAFCVGLMPGKLGIPNFLPAVVPVAGAG